MNSEFITTVTWIGAVAVGIVLLDFGVIRWKTIVPAIALAVVAGLICAVGRLHGT